VGGTALLRPQTRRLRLWASSTTAAFADPKVQARLADLGAPVLRGTPSDFREFITKETERWGKVIRNANIKAR
jgi:tripartite-type tricarboxylate transporter receptor subunit TctC